MGLEIAVLTSLEPSEELGDGVWWLGNHEYYPDHLDDIAPGRYTATLSGTFRAGSYSAYNNWRDDLANMVGYPPNHADRKPGGPFWELINFTDSSGAIGPQTSAKLAADFKDHDRLAAKVSPRFYATYVDFREAFTQAAENDGVVVFY